MVNGPNISYMTRIGAAVKTTMRAIIIGEKKKKYNQSDIYINIII